MLVQEALEAAGATGANLQQVWGALKTCDFAPEMLADAAFTNLDVSRHLVHLSARLQGYIIAAQRQAAGQGTRPAVQIPDPSQAQILALLEPSLQQLPPLDQLAPMLCQPLPARLKINPSAYQRLCQDDPQLATQFEESQPADHKLQTRVSCIIMDDLRFGSEYLTASAVDAVLVRLILSFDDILPATSPKRVAIVLQRDQADSTSLMTLKSPLGKSLRPDLAFRAQDELRLLFKGEEMAESSSLDDAKEDLRTKTAVWSPLYYGSLEYLLSYAAAGSRLQFCALRRASPVYPVAVGPCHDISTPRGRAGVVLAAFQLLRLLSAVNLQLPQSVLPVGKDLVTKSSLGFTRTLHFRSDIMAVQKNIKPWSVFQREFHLDLRWLEDMYAATAGSAGLVHRIVGTAPSLVVDDQYSVLLQPVGLRNEDARPKTEADACRALHGFLHGLHALHRVGWVHRDIRWENTACDASKQHFFLLDLETVAPADQLPGFQLASWGDGTLQANLYTTLSDLRMLGKMMFECKYLLKSQAAQEVLHLLTGAAGPTSDLSAQSLLNSTWIACSGETCRAAGAQPDAC